MLMKTLHAFVLPVRSSYADDGVTTHREMLRLPYRPEDLFELASDVARYPQFITWMQSLKILRSDADTETSRCRAEVTVGFRGFRETFVTDVEAHKAKLAIDVSLVRGPFRNLSNSWRFAPAADGSQVTFVIQFRFYNPILQAFADANKDYAVKRVIKAFTDEAERRYRKISDS